MTIKLLEIAADLVKAQASAGGMSAEDVELALTRTFTALQKMQAAEEAGLPVDLSRLSGTSSLERQAPEKADPKASIQKDKIICLECGAEMRQLTAMHLKTHDLTARAYRQKWGLSPQQPLCAEALTRARSRAAKKRGLPEKLLNYFEERRRKKRQTALPGTTVAIPTPTEKAEVKAVAKQRRKQKSE
jgi:predicted transcriptional regulator